jgi:transcriptional regulator with XRE-family HTH domain
MADIVLTKEDERNRKKLYRLQAKLKLSKQQLADELGISLRQLYHYDQGLRRVPRNSVRLLEYIAKEKTNGSVTV